MKYIIWVLLSTTALFLNACYTEPNPLSSVATIGGPIALVRTFTITNPANNTQVSAVTASSGAALTLTVAYTTLDAPVTQVNLYRLNGTTKTSVSNVSVNVSPSANQVRQTFTYTVPAGTAAGTRIVLLAGVVTSGGESWSGSGILSTTGVPTAGTVAITVQ